MFVAEKKEKIFKTKNETKIRRTSTKALRV